jgi:hypothetical protein
MWRFNVADSITSDFGSFGAHLPPPPATSEVAKLTILEIFNAMSNVSTESVFRSLADIVKTLHADEAKRIQQAAVQSKSNSAANSSSVVLAPTPTAPTASLVVASTVTGTVALAPTQQSEATGVPFAPQRRSSRPLTTAHNQDSVVSDFLAFFCEFGTKPYTDAGCSNLLALCRELMATHNPHAVLLLFRAMDTYLPKAPKSTLRKLKREFQEVLQKIVDSLMSIGSRTFVDYSASWRTEARFFLSQDDPNINVGSSLTGPSALNNVGLPAGGEEASGTESSESSIGDDTEMASMKRLLCLQALANLSTKLTAFLEKAFESEKDRITAIVSQLAHQLIFIVKQKTSTDPAAQRTPNSPTSH